MAREITLVLTVDEVEVLRSLLGSYAQSDLPMGAVKDGEMVPLPDDVAAYARENLASVLAKLA